MKSINIKNIMVCFKFVFLLLILLLLSSCFNQEKDVIENNIENVSTVEEKNDEIIIVAYGDSLTEGLGVNREDSYPSQLEKNLKDLNFNIKVHNSGVSGETSSSALERIEWVLRLNPDIVILGIGANDAMRGIDLKLTKENIEKIVVKLKENDVKVILLGQIIYENLGSEYVEEFETIYPNIANKHNLTFVDNFLKGIVGNSSLNNNDEIHPNKEGYKIIVEQNVLPKVLEIIEKKN